MIAYPVRHYFLEFLQAQQTNSVLGHRQKTTELVIRPGVAVVVSVSMKTSGVGPKRGTTGPHPPGSPTGSRGTHGDHGLSGGSVGHGRCSKVSRTAARGGHGRTTRTS